MKKNLIKIFMIIIIANILILSTESLATQAQDELMPQIYLQVSDSSSSTADPNWILNIVLNGNVKTFKDEQISTYLSNLKEAQKNGKIDYSTAQRAIEQLENEQKSRAIANNKSSDTEVIDYIINMKDSALDTLTNIEINSYIYKLKAMDASTVNESRLNAALARLNSKIASRTSNDDNSDDEFDYSNYTPGGTSDSKKIQTMAGKVLGIIRNIGVAVSIIALTVIGIKYMFGSVEKKAEYKKSMIPFVIGIIMLAAGTTLVTFIYETVSGEQQSTKSSSGSSGGPGTMTFYESMLQ